MLQSFDFTSIFCHPTTFGGSSPTECVLKRCLLSGVICVCVFVENFWVTLIAIVFVWFSRRFLAQICVILVCVWIEEPCL